LEEKMKKTKIGTILAWDVCLIPGTVPQNLGWLITLIKHQNVCSFINVFENWYHTIFYELSFKRL